MRRLLKRLLGGDHDIIEAADGSIGVARFAGHAPQLVITDIVMPNKEGIETIREIRRLAPAAKIMAISGGGRSGNPQYLDMASKLGADVTLTKPLHAPSLRAAVNTLLASSSVGSCAR